MRQMYINNSLSYNLHGKKKSLLFAEQWVLLAIYITFLFVVQMTNKKLGHNSRCPQDVSTAQTKMANVA